MEETTNYEIIDRIKDSERMTSRSKNRGVWEHNLVFYMLLFLFPIACNIVHDFFFLELGAWKMQI